MGTRPARIRVATLAFLLAASTAAWAGEPDSLMCHGNPDLETFTGWHRHHRPPDES